MNPDTTGPGSPRSTSENRPAGADVNTATPPGV